MDEKMIRVKCLILTGREMYTIPGLAIIGAACVVTAACYGVYKFTKNIIKIREETDESIESLSEFRNE